MSARVATFTFTRPRVLIPGILGAVLLLKGWLVAGFILALIAVTKAARMLGDDELDWRLRQRQERMQHGVDRALTHGERAELTALDTYVMTLERRGVEASLVQEVRQRGWEIMRKAGINDATVDLKRFREGLPTVASFAPPAPEESLEARLERELVVLNAGQKEIDSLR